MVYRDKISVSCDGQLEKNRNGKRNISTRKEKAMTEQFITFHVLVTPTLT